MLDHILRGGDRVRMKMDSESRYWGVKGVPDGTLGAVRGRFRAEGIIEPRYPRSPFREEGVYSKDGVPLITWDEYPDGVDPLDPDYARANATWLEPADTFYKEYQARAKTEWPVRLEDGRSNPDFCIIKDGDRLDNLERTGDLPETPFWELDIVSFEGKRYQIFRIGYFRWGPQKEHSYDIQGVNKYNEYDRGGTTSAPANGLRLIERGNVWKEAHGETPTFHSLSEEATYATNTNRAHTVRNPATGYYDWTLDQVLEAIKNGVVDGFTNPTIPFSDQRHIQPRLFDDRDLGQRIREETLKGFKITA